MVDTIEKVVKKNLCTGCGTCKSICQYNAITMIRNIADFVIPKIDNNTCNQCGLCLLACPGAGLPKNLLKKYDDIFWGSNISAYVGRACDEEIWKNGQSGGIVSALLLYLLDKELVDVTFVNSFDQNTKRPFIKKAYNKQDILNAQGSYYAQSAVNEMAINCFFEKTAAVVLGCQAEGIELSKRYVNKYNTPEYLIGLICAGNHSGLILDDLINQSGIKHDDICLFRFRDKRYNTWPGNVLIKSENKQAVINKSRRMALKKYYGNYRCQCCFDQMNIFSDIVVGDPWGITADNKEKGLSVFIARTKKGKDLIESAMEENYIRTQIVPIEEVYKGQTVDCRLKTQFFTNKELCEKENMSFPEYDIDFSIYNYEKCNDKIIKQKRNLLKRKKEFHNIKSKKKVYRIISTLKAEAFLKNKKNRLKKLLKKLFSKVRSGV